MFTSVVLLQWRNLNRPLQALTRCYVTSQWLRRVGHESIPENNRYPLPPEHNVKRKMSCSFSAVDSVCGPTPYAPNELYVIPLKLCRKDLTDYLTNLGVSRSQGFGTQINEADVILIAQDCIHYQRKTGKGLSKAQIRINNTLPEVQVQCSHPSYNDEAKKFKKSSSGKQTGVGRNISGVSSFSSNRIRKVK